MTHAPRIAATALAVLTLWALPPPARAITPFGSADSRVRQVYCDMSAVSGRYSATEAQYSASGACVGLESPQKTTDASTGTSEFPRVNESKETFRAAWTAKGSYNPLTKEVIEKVTMPAPNIDEKTPAGRPYGNYESRMICATDPWLTGIGVNCTGKTVRATGNLGEAEAALRRLNRPVTTPNKAPQLQALNASHDRYVKAHDFTSKSATTGKSSVIAQMFAPSVVEPRPGSTHAPQTAMRVRVAPAKEAKDTAYELEIQVKANFDWRVLTTIPVNAQLAQSAPGYKGWGAHLAGTGPQMTAIAGEYRIRARATAPRRSEPGDWVEFRIAGKPGVTTQELARAKVDRVGGAPAALKPGLAAATTGTSRSTTPHGGALPAGTVPAARPLSPLLVPADSSLSAAKNKANAVSLNPQPLPPAAAPVQVPSALR